MDMNIPVTAIITAVITLLVCLINNYCQSKRESEKRKYEWQEVIANQNQAMALIEYKIGELTNEVKAHNNFARRMPVVEEQIKVINNRIKDLEDAMK